jgi:hypothetical protein
VGAQSHGSVCQIRTDAQIARPPIFYSAVFIYSHWQAAKNFLTYL